MISRLRFHYACIIISINSYIVLNPFIMNQNISKIYQNMIRICQLKTKPCKVLLCWASSSFFEHLGCPDDWPCFTWPRKATIAWMTSKHLCGALQKYHAKQMLNISCVMKMKWEQHRKDIEKHSTMMNTMSKHMLLGICKAPQTLWCAC